MFLECRSTMPRITPSGVTTMVCRVSVSGQEKSVCHWEDNCSCEILCAGSFHSPRVVTVPGKRIRTRRMQLTMSTPPDFLSKEGGIYRHFSAGSNWKRRTEAIVRLDAGRRSSARKAIDRFFELYSTNIDTINQL
mmetsp:Transcript_28110/g.76259  ORF Transcript_28110/g.76259 Transcript_28110/m.76259 type:complete len:135 (-) Transcript_28110:59-463(-)